MLLVSFVPCCARLYYRSTNSHKYFNLHHAQLCNVVECIIGVLKLQFQILVIPPKYNIDIQAKIPIILCGIYTITHEYDSEELSNAKSQYSIQTIKLIMWWYLGLWWMVYYNYSMENKGGKVG